MLAGLGAVITALGTMGSQEVNWPECACVWGEGADSQDYEVRKLGS